MPTIAAQIAALESSLEVGAIRTEDENGREVEYGKQNDILDAIGRLKSQLQQSSTGRGYAINTFKISGTRG